MHGVIELQNRLTDLGRAAAFRRTVTAKQSHFLLQMLTVTAKEYSEGCLTTFDYAVAFNSMMLLLRMRISGWKLLDFLLNTIRCQHSARAVRQIGFRRKLTFCPFAFRCSVELHIEYLVVLYASFVLLLQLCSVSTTGVPLRN